MGSSQSMLSPIGNVMELVYVSFFWKCNSNFFFLECCMRNDHVLFQLYATAVRNVFYILDPSEYWNSSFLLLFWIMVLIMETSLLYFFFFTYVEVNVFFCWESSFLLCHCPLGFFRPWLLTFPANSVFLSVIVYQLILMI